MVFGGVEEYSRRTRCYSRQGSVRLMLLLERGETGKSNNLCSSLGFASDGRIVTRTQT